MLSTLQYRFQWAQIHRPLTFPGVEAPPNGLYTGLCGNDGGSTFLVRHVTHYNTGDHQLISATGINKSLENKLYNYMYLFFVLEANIRAFSAKSTL